VGMVHASMGNVRIHGHCGGAPLRLTCTVHNELIKGPETRPHCDKSPVASIVSDARPESNRRRILIFEQSAAPKSNPGPT
jgi:hypothetical protein